MQRLVERLKIQKHEADEWSYDRGREDGKEWAIEFATYSDLVNWSKVPTNENYLNGVPLPEAADVEYVVEAEKDATDAGEALDRHRYAVGFLEAVREVWHSVSSEL